MIIKEYVASRKEALKEYVATLSIKPKLVIIQLNEDDASNAYVKGKIKDLTFIGADYIHDKRPIDTTQEELLNIIDQYNKDDSVDGILVQMPLPKQINENIIKESVIPSKDVDGFHPMSTMIPCTPKGILDYLKNEKVEILGKNAVVIGRSNIVGKPMAKLLLSESANVTVLHSKTSPQDFKMFVKNADIIVVATGKKYLLNSDFEFKPTATIVDVGINRIDGILYGDAEPNLPVALQTPVPGGVGLLTRISMIENLILCYKNRRK